MKIMPERSHFSLCLLIIFALVISACSERKESKENALKALRLELLDMKVSDQYVREQASIQNSNGRLSKELAAMWDSTDKANTIRIKEIIDQHGWPGFSQVGEDAASAAWVLVQHADKDRNFQKQALRLLEGAVSKNDADPKHLAYLTDRVRVAEKLPQVYGTQIDWSLGYAKPYPIEDSVNVDKRRIEVGLDSLSLYMKRFRK